jgi:hypothetical protein
MFFRDADQPWPRQGSVLRGHAALRIPQRGRLRDRGDRGGCLLDLVGGDVHSMGAAPAIGVVLAVLLARVPVVRVVGVAAGGGTTPARSAARLSRLDEGDPASRSRPGRGGCRSSGRGWINRGYRARWPARIRSGDAQVRPGQSRQPDSSKQSSVPACARRPEPALPWRDTRLHHRRLQHRLRRLVTAPAGWLSAPLVPAAGRPETRDPRPGWIVLAGAALLILLVSLACLGWLAWWRLTPAPHVYGPAGGSSTSS